MWLRTEDGLAGVPPRDTSLIAVIGAGRQVQWLEQNAAKRACGAKRIHAHCASRLAFGRHR